MSESRQVPFNIEEQNGVIVRMIAHTVESLPVTPLIEDIPPSAALTRHVATVEYIPDETTSKPRTDAIVNCSCGGHWVHRNIGRFQDPMKEIRETFDGHLRYYARPGIRGD